MKYSPGIPRFSRSKGRDGKLRLYLVASTLADIELMLHLCGCLRNGIIHQTDSRCDLWYRIIRKQEEALINKVFEIGGT